MITLETVCVIKGTSSWQDLQTSAPAGIIVISGTVSGPTNYAIVRLFSDDTDLSVDGFTNMSTLSDWSYVDQNEAASMFSSGDVVALATMLRGLDQSFGIGLQ